MVEKKGDLVVTFGGWYQRTTLHLTEIYEFFTNGVSRINLSKDKLLDFQKKLRLTKVTREIGYLEYIHAKTKDGIEIKYYEDGLYVLSLAANDFDIASDILKKYFEEHFNPAINYIFSLGAPTPKILSNLKDIHPFVIGLISRDHANFIVNEKKFGKVYSKVTYRETSVYKTENYIFVISAPLQERNLLALIEMQIFFREFKDQLHKYLNIHRKIWEDISEIKEKKYIRGKEVGLYRTKLEAYKKTIDLISSRINQMPTYAHTRASLAKHLNIDKDLVVLFEYRFEDLFNTLSYIKEIWAMTVSFVNSTIAILVEIDNKRSMGGIRSIQLLASISVVTGLIGYLTRDTVPQISQTGIFFLVIMGVIALVLDFSIKLFAVNKRYKLKYLEHETEL